MTTATTAPAAAARATSPIVFQTIPLATPPLAMDLALSQYTDRTRRHFNGNPAQVQEFAALAQADRAKVQVISGLVHFGIDEHLPSAALYVTLLRDPVECALALYYLVLSSPTHYMHKLIVDAGWKVEDLITHKRAEIDNPLTRALNPRPARSLAFGQITPDMVEHARRVLAERYLFGLSERFEESMALFQRTLGWTPVAYPGKQALPPRPLQESVRPSTVAQLREINAIDTELYSYAQELFERRIQDLQPALDQDVAELRERNARRAAESVWIRDKAVTAVPDDPTTADIVWLASYPRSGNTWFRFLLDSYIFPPAQMMHDVGRSSLELDWWMGEAARLNQPESWIVTAARMVRERHARPAGFPNDLLFKTHFALSGRHPLRSRTRAAIVLIRDPKDVLLSGMNFSELTSGQPLASERGYAMEFIEAGGDPGWIRTGYGSWDDHAQTWADTADFPVLRIRYEDLKADTPREFRKVLEFIGAPIDDARIRQAVDHCSFARLRNLEVASRAMTAMPKLRNQDKFFFHKGLSGQSLAHLGEDVAAAFRRRFAGPAARWGYSA